MSRTVPTSSGTATRHHAPDTHAVATAAAPDQAQSPASTPARPRPGPAIAGLIAPGLFFVTMTVLGFLTPGYSPVHTAASNLSLGKYGWVMIANFVVYGILEIIFARGLWLAYRSAQPGRLGARAVALNGVAFLVAGVFVTDPVAGKVTTLHGMLHVAAALALFFVAWPIAMIAFARYFRTARIFSVISMAAAVVIPVLFIATWADAGIFGLLERLMLAAGWAWLTVLAARLYVHDRKLAGRAIPRPRAATAWSSPSSS